MFLFTREFIINDNGGNGIKGLLKSGKRFECTDGILKVARMVNLRKDDVVSVSKVAGAAAVDEKVVITPNQTLSVEEGDIVRLVITIGQQGRVTALVNDYHPLHKKQYFYEAAVETDGELPLEAFVKVAKKEAAMEAPDRLIDVVLGSDSDDDSASAKGDLVITALDQYTRIEEVRIVTVPKDSDRPTGEILTGYMDYDAVVLWRKDGSATTTGCSVELTAGTEGAGTVAQILKNKRLLTDANIDPYGYDLDERPIPGGLYDQYLVEQLSERRHIGGQVFGSIDQSLTSHVFFVLTGDVSDAFAAALEELTGKEAEEVEVQDPSPAVEDAPTLPKRLLARKGEVSEESSVSE